jgi:hypothetical protein
MDVFRNSIKDRAGCKTAVQGGHVAGFPSRADDNEIEARGPILGRVVRAVVTRSLAAHSRGQRWERRVERDARVKLELNTSLAPSTGLDANYH